MDDFLAPPPHFDLNHHHILRIWWGDDGTYGYNCGPEILNHQMVAWQDPIVIRVIAVLNNFTNSDQLVQDFATIHSV